MKDKLTAESLIDGEHYFSIKLPIYGVLLRVFPKSEYATAFYSIDCENHSLSAFVNVMQKDGYSEVCMVFGDAVSEFDTSTICHESLHAAWRCLDLVGVVVNSKNHEALAYLAGWIFDQVEVALLPAAENFSNSQKANEVSVRDHKSDIGDIEIDNDFYIDTDRDIQALRRFIEYAAKLKFDCEKSNSRNSYGACIDTANFYIKRLLEANKK